MHPQPGGTLAVDCAMVAPTTVERAGSRSAAASGAAESLECGDGFVITQSLEEDTQDPVAATVSNELEEDTQPLMGHGSDESDMGPDVEISGEIRDHDVDVEETGKIRENDFDETWDDRSPHGRMASSKSSKKGDQVDEVQETQGYHWRDHVEKVQETQVFSGDPDEEVQEKQVSQVEDTDYTQNTEDISLPSTRSWLPEGEVASQPSIVTIRGPSPMSGEPGVYSDSEDTSDGDDSENYLLEPYIDEAPMDAVDEAVDAVDALQDMVTVDEAVDAVDALQEMVDAITVDEIPERSSDESDSEYMSYEEYRSIYRSVEDERAGQTADVTVTERLGRRDRSRSRARTAGSSSSD